MFSKKKLINLTKFCQLPIYKLLQILKNWQSSKSRNANFLSKLSYFQQKNSSLFSSIKKYYRSQNIVNFWFPLLENYHPIFDHPDKQKKSLTYFSSIFFKISKNSQKILISTLWSVTGDWIEALAHPFVAAGIVVYLVSGEARPARRPAKFRKPMPVDF